METEMKQQQRPEEGTRVKKRKKSVDNVCLE